MDIDTQADLVTQIRANNMTAWTAFVTAHLGMVYDLAKVYTNGGGQEQFNDLVGDGELALCEAGREYVEQDIDCRFSTYAFVRIERAMVTRRRTDGGVSTEWLARTCQAARESLDRLQARFAEFGIDRPPTPDELAYVEGTYHDDVTDEDVRRQCERLLGTPKFVEIDEGASYSHALPLQTDATDRSFARQLPPTTRHVWTGLLDQMEATNNVSLSIEAERSHISRDDVIAQIAEARSCWEAIQ